eukprot:62148-Pyramimonas_sp.AAC.1
MSKFARAPRTRATQEPINTLNTYANLKSRGLNSPSDRGTAPLLRRHYVAALLVLFSTPPPSIGGAG